MFDNLINWLKGGSSVQGQPSIQPNLAKVDAAFYTYGATAEFVNYTGGVETDVLLAPVVGSTVDFAPEYPLVPNGAVIMGGGVPLVQGSNSPQGGKCN